MPAQEQNTHQPPPSSDDRVNRNFEFSAGQNTAQNTLDTAKNTQAIRNDLSWLSDQSVYNRQQAMQAGLTGGGGALGAILGGGLGALSEKNKMRNAILGILLGGAGGAGLGHVVARQTYGPSLV